MIPLRLSFLNWMFSILAKSLQNLIVQVLIKICIKSLNRFRFIPLISIRFIRFGRICCRIALIMGLAMSLAMRLTMRLTLRLAMRLIIGSVRFGCLLYMLKGPT
ncbi:hypothetical protein WICMUC_005247 [Wickerhamomyces mucosus]|uniref:Uncharacterized protein n=1 Tax=Wickerhamomyces mucosus TaxID=1378264 RepID=A0A9P8P9F3_9ASCO|nr:hypothetical protein WICMUC_005247 [Wickerhamomyces mucosus]